MFEKIIQISLKNKALVLLATVFLILGGISSLRNIPLDAVPDITNNQVQIVTVSPSLASEEVEKFITYPIEMAMANLPGREEIRSISRYGLSVVTIVFDDYTPVMLARQYASEQINIARESIPAGLGEPELMPITTGLGEIYQYVLMVEESHRDRYNAMDLRTLQDWLVKRQLTGIPGVVEVSSFGGYLKQYEVGFDPLRMQALGITVDDVLGALEQNNQNTGGGYIEQGENALYIRTKGLLENLDELAIIPVLEREGKPVLMRDIATIRYAPALRYGAMTMDGQGEVVGGITLMLKGANSYEVVEQIKNRVASVQKSLPPGVTIKPYLDRSALIDKTINTASTNLIEGGIIVIFVLMLLLGDVRASMMVASVIPLAMLFALICMDYFGVSANLMSLGAIDFGIVVDGAVIITEAALFAMHHKFIGKKLSQHEMDSLLLDESSKVYSKAAFGVLIILVVFLPILSLGGIEGKMFKPMAQTVSFALLGALILSLTFVPVAASYILNKNIRKPWAVSERIMNAFKFAYDPVLNYSLRNPLTIVSISAVVLLISVFAFTRMGTEFLPNLEEGDLAMQMAIKPGSSLQESIAASTKAERILKENFPEVKHVVSKIGTAEIPTDPMAIEDADIMIILKDKKEWTTADNREDLADAMKEKLSDILGAQFEFTQPIQLRFNELLSGAKADIAVKIYGEDHEELHNLGLKAGGLFKNINGAADVKVEQTEGLPQLLLRFNREKMSRYGVHVTQINRVVRSAFAGETAGTVFEGEKRFDLVLRLDSVHRFSGKIDQLSVRSATGENIPLRELVEVSYESGPMQISRDNAQRRIAIGINVRNRDMGSLVEEIQQIMETKMNLPPGYSYKVGGQYENFVNASQRLMIAVPLALLLIVVLLFFAFQSVKYALLIFTAVPLSAVGGIAALLIRDMPFSISAGVGFIALFGVAVLNGIVLISHINSLKSSADLNLTEIITQGAGDRLRPVLMTAAVAIMGFTPMALSNGAGAEVQKPLATVVIGGLITATFLTMVVLPSLLLLLERGIKLKKELITLAALFAFAPLAQAQNAINREQVIDSAFANNPEWLNAGLESEQATVRRQTAVELNPLSVQYQQGQIDGPERTDYTLSIEQDFGSLLTHMRRASELNTREQLAQAAVQLKARELKYEVLLKYENWVYAQERFLLAKKEFDVFKKLEEKLENQYKAGEISALELNRSRNQLYQFYALLLREEQNFRQATRDIYDIALLDKLYQPAQTNLEPLLLQPDSSLSAILLEPSSLAVQAGEKAAKSLAGDFFPAINAGYYKLRLDPYTNLGAFSVGITIPLWFVPQNSRVKEAQIEVMKRNNEFFALQKRYQNALQLQWAAYANYRLRWQESITDALKSANDLQKQAEESFLRGETDYLNLAVSIETAIMLKFTYLENLFLMNQHGIKLQFLVDQN